MKHTISKALTAITLTAALLASVSATAFAAEDTSTADEVNPGNYEYTITDATNVQKAIAQIITLTDEQEFLYDIDGSEGITISDATTIQKIVAKICEQPTYHEGEVATTVEHPAEYETVTEQEWVEAGETPVYICWYRYTCSNCGEDLTLLEGRYDTAVANGEIDPTDEKYGLENIDGHYYSFFEYGNAYLILTDGTCTFIESDNCRHTDKHVYASEDCQIEPQYGWYSYDGPSNLSNDDLWKYFISHDSELAYALSGSTVLSNLQVWELEYYSGLDYDDVRTDTCTFEDDEAIWSEEFEVAVKNEEGHYENVTKQVLVKEAWSEEVTEVKIGWYCD